jgi:hypothetical protein
MRVNQWTLLYQVSCSLCISKAIAVAATAYCSDYEYTKHCLGPHSRVIPSQQRQERTKMPFTLFI